MPQTEAQKKASKKWESRQTTLACKVKKEIADEILKQITERGYKNYSSYLKDLIRKDLNIKF